MSQLDHDLARLVREDPLPQGIPDTAGLIRLGSRLRRRRQLAVTAGVGLAAAAVVAPFLLLGGGGEAVDLAPADEPAASVTPDVTQVASSPSQSPATTPVASATPTTTPSPSPSATSTPSPSPHNPLPSHSPTGAPRDPGTVAPPPVG